MHLRKSPEMIVVIAAALLLVVVSLCALVSRVIRPEQEEGQIPIHGQTGQTDPTDPTDPTKPGFDGAGVTYEDYQAMTGDEQLEFYLKFDTHADFTEWYKAAKQEYDDNKQDIIVGEDGTIDLGKLPLPQ